jgi:hypothetical protein
VRVSRSEPATPRGSGPFALTIARRLGADLEELDGVEVRHVATDSPVGVEEHIRLAGEGVAEISNPKLVDDETARLPITEGHREPIAGMFSSNSTGRPRSDGGAPDVIPARQIYIRLAKS